MRKVWLFVSIYLVALLALVVYGGARSHFADYFAGIAVNKFVEEE